MKIRDGHRIKRRQTVQELSILGFDGAPQFCQYYLTHLNDRRALQILGLRLKGAFAVSKIALPALVLVIFGLFYLSIEPNAFDGTSEITGPRAQITQALFDTDKTEQNREQLGKAIDGVRAELQQLSDTVKSNSEKIADTAKLRADLQETRSSNTKAAQNMLDQIGALRSDQTKFLQDAKDTGDKAAQALRKDVEASQAKVSAQVDDTLKASNARAETLAQRIDAMKKDIENVKKDLDENTSNISPAFALVVALAALLLGPFVARQLTANQLAAAKKEAAAEAAVAAHPAAVKTVETEASLAATEPPQKTFFDEAPSVGEETTVHDDKSEHHHAERDPEKV